jgi:hypothetical protein
MRHLEECDTDVLTISAVNRAFGTMWFGDERPTVIISSRAIKEQMMCLIRREYLKPLPWAKNLEEGFLFNGAYWIHAECIKDGEIHMHNSRFPDSERFNGWFKVG